MTLIEALAIGVSRVRLSDWPEMRYLKAYVTADGSVLPWVEFYNGLNPITKSLIWDHETEDAFDVYEGLLHPLDYLGNGFFAP